MIIGIDARFYGPVGKGLGRYTQEVVDRVILLNKQRSEKDLSFVIFLSKENYSDFKVVENNVIKVKADFIWYSLAEQLKFPILIKKHKIDLMHFPHFNVPIFCPSRFIVTIHDLILTKFPTVRATTKNYLTYFFKNLAYRLVIRTAITKSDKILTVSNFTKNDILKFFRVSEDKIVLSYEGVANLEEEKDYGLFRKKIFSDQDLAKSLEKNFIFYVGSAYPHKNLERLLAVFSKIKEEKIDLNLILAGKDDYFYKLLKKEAESLGLFSPLVNIFDNRVIFLGQVSDADLLLLYSKARAFIFPSLYEGFGLPPLEAMTHSCPVLSSDKSSLPEILADNVLYFDPESVEDMFSKIKMILSNNELRNSLITSGREWVKRYSWHDCAEKTLDLYLQVLSKVKNNER